MEKPQKRTSKKKILLVEDDPLLVDIYKTQLVDDGFNVDVAVCGGECLKKLKEKKYDLMLLDIVLPKTDGWEILTRVRQQKQARKSNKTLGLKIIILSNLGLKEEIQKGFRLGADGYLIKAHYTPCQVSGEVKKTLSKSL